MSWHTDTHRDIVHQITGNKQPNAILLQPNGKYVDFYVRCLLASDTTVIVLQSSFPAWLDDIPAAQVYNNNACIGGMIPGGDVLLKQTVPSSGSQEGNHCRKRDGMEGEILG